MIRFLSTVAPVEIARVLANALGSKDEPVLCGPTRDETGAIDTTAVHWYCLTADENHALAPHDIDGPGARTFSFRYRYWDDERMARVYAAIECVGYLATIS